MKALKITAAAILLLFALTGFACALENQETWEDYYNEQYESSGAQDLERALPQDVRDYMDSAGLGDIDFYSIFEASPQRILELFFDVASGNAGEPIKGVARIAGIILLTAIARSLFPADDKLEGALELVCAGIIAVSVFSPLADTVSRGVSAISASADFMLALIPVLAAVITVSGNPSLALSYNTLTFAAAQSVSELSRSAVLPLSGVFTACGVISSMCGNLRLDKLTQLIKKTAFATLSFTAALFSALLSLKGIMATAADNLVAKGIRLAVGSAIPVVGGAISDAYSSIVGSLALLKNAVGVFGIAAVALINLPVMAEILFWIFGFKLSAVFAGLLGDERVSDMLEVVASSLTLINVMVLFGALLFILSTGIIISLRTSV